MGLSGDSKLHREPDNHATQETVSETLFSQKSHIFLANGFPVQGRAELVLEKAAIPVPPCKQDSMQ